MINSNGFNNHISDEMLAAYIDGNATLEESSLIENTLASDSMLSESLDLASDAISLGANFDWGLHKGDYGFWELGLPPVISEDDLVSNDIVAVEDYFETSLSTIIDKNTTSDNDSFYQLDNSIDDELDFLDDFDILDL